MENLWNSLHLFKHFWPTINYVIEKTERAPGLWSHHTALKYTQLSTEYENEPKWKSVFFFFSTYNTSSLRVWWERFWKNILNEKKREEKRRKKRKNYMKTGLSQALIHLHRRLIKYTQYYDSIFFSLKHTRMHILNHCKALGVFFLLLLSASTTTMMTTKTTTRKKQNSISAWSCVSKKSIPCDGADWTNPIINNNNNNSNNTNLYATRCAVSGFESSLPLCRSVLCVIFLLSSCFVRFLRRLRFVNVSVCVYGSLTSSTNWMLIMLLVPSPSLSLCFVLPVSHAMYLMKYYVLLLWNMN